VVVHQTAIVTHPLTVEATALIISLATMDVPQMPTVVKANSAPLTLPLWIPAAVPYVRVRLDAL